MQGWSPLASAALAPACFGLAHLHHLRELTVHQGLTLATALPLVRHCCNDLCHHCCLAMQHQPHEDCLRRHYGKK